MLGSSDQRHSSNFVFSSMNIGLKLKYVSLHIHHITCGVSSGVSGKYFPALCKGVPLEIQPSKK